MGGWSWRPRTLDLGVSREQKSKNDKLDVETQSRGKKAGKGPAREDSELVALSGLGVVCDQGALGCVKGEQENKQPDFLEIVYILRRCRR